MERIVSIIDNARVVGDSGKSYPVKYAKPVPSESTAAVPQAVSGSAQHSERARRELRYFANRVHNHFRGQTTSLHVVGRYLRELGEFEVASRRARIRQRTKVVSFLRQFPEFFTVSSTLGRGEVTVAV